MDPQFNEVSTNSLESVGKRKKMKPKSKSSKAPMDDGDGAHWESAREKEKAMKAPRSSGIYVQPSEKRRAKKISTGVAASGRTEKFMGKRKPVRKPSVKK